MVSRITPVGNQVDRTVAPIAFANGVAGGWIGYSETLSTQGPGFTSETDVSGCSVQVTVNSSRRILIEAYVLASGNTAADIFSAFIKEGAAQLQRDVDDVKTSNIAFTSMRFNPKVVLTPTAGLHTYKVTLVRSSGTGNASVLGTASQPCFIRVFDDGPA